MTHIGIALIYVAFFALIAFAMWFLDSPWPLTLIFFMPDYKYTDKS